MPRCGRDRASAMSLVGAVRAEEPSGAACVRLLLTVARLGSELTRHSKVRSRHHLHLLGARLHAAQLLDLAQAIAAVVCALARPPVGHHTRARPAAVARPLLSPPADVAPAADAARRLSKHRQLGVHCPALRGRHGRLWRADGLHPDAQRRRPARQAMGDRGRRARGRRPARTRVLFRHGRLLGHLRRLRARWRPDGRIHPSARRLWGICARLSPARCVQATPRRQLNGTD